MSKSSPKFEISRRNFLKVASGAVGVGGMGAGLVACSNSRGPTYYTLSQFSVGPGYLGVPYVIEVMAPSLAGSLGKDRSIAGLKPDQLLLNPGGAMWGEDLSLMIGQVMVSNIAASISDTHVFLQNQANGTIKPDVYVEMDISCFKQDDSGNAAVTVGLSVYRPRFKSGGFYRVLDLSHPSEGSSVQELVVAFNELLGGLAAYAVKKIVTLPTEQQYQGG